VRCAQSQATKSAKRAWQRECIPVHRGASSADSLLHLAQITDALPAGFETMRAEARAEGYRFLERLATDWAAHMTRFDATGEALLAAFLDVEPAAIGGMTIDPFIPGALRMRRFYVRPRFRRRGIGKSLAAALLERAAATGRPITVDAPAAAFAFWEALGFRHDPRAGHTHLRDPRAGE
jgi:GNAT superfamily N-acetyltransferase